MKQIVLLTAVITLAFKPCSGQESQVLYFMNLPQNHLLNPAFKSTNQLYIGLPVISSINVNITNNFFNLSTLFTQGERISRSTFAFLDTDFDKEGFLNNLKKLNYFDPEFSVQLLGLGINLRNGIYAYLDIVDHAVVNLVSPRDIIKLSFLGNENFSGQTIDLSDMRGDFYYYHEIGIGASKSLSSNLRFGAKAKLLYGIIGGSFRNYALKLTVNNDYTNTLDANLSLDISGLVNFYTDQNNRIIDAEIDKHQFETGRDMFRTMTNFRNGGFGIDFGAEYSVNEQLVFSGAITNVGFIRWKSDLANLETSGKINMSGLDIEDIYAGRANFDEVTKSIIDSLKNASYLEGSQKPFTTKLPVGLTLAGKYNFNDKFSIGILSYSRITGQQIREAVTLSANMNIGNNLSTSLAYSAFNSNYANIGFGIGFRASVAQFYFLLDRIPLRWERVGTSGESLVLPNNLSTVHTRFGLNLIFGNKVKTNR